MMLLVHLLLVAAAVVVILGVTALVIIALFQMGVRDLAHAVTPLARERAEQETE